MVLSKKSTILLWIKHIDEIWQACVIGLVAKQVSSGSGPSAGEGQPLRNL